MLVGMELEELIARGPARTSHNDNDQWGLRQTSTFKVVGRHMLNVWRIMRSEQTLRAYTFENVADHLLHERYVLFFLKKKKAAKKLTDHLRFPYYTSATLTRWFRSTIPDQVAHLLRYFHERTRAVIRMLDAAQVVTKTACVHLDYDNAFSVC
jgi:DNA polymerase zeta